MAIRILLTPPTLPNADESVIETLVEISTDSGFSTILGSISTAIPNEFYNVSLGIELVPGDTYYARASFVTDLAGAEGWGPTVEFVATNVVEQSISLKPPDVAIAPVLSIPLYGPEGTPLTNFRVGVDIDPTIDSEAVSADLIIEDVEGNVVVGSLGIDSDLRSINIQRWLRPDEIYIIKVSIELASGAKSMYGGLVITTGGISGDFRILDHIVTLATSEIVMQIPPGSSHVELELYDHTSLIYSDLNVLGSSAFYDSDLEALLEVGRVRNVYLDGTKSNWFYFYNVPKPTTLPLELPSELG